MLPISIVNCYPMLWHKEYKRSTEPNIWKKSVPEFISRLKYISAQESFAFHSNENMYENCTLFINHIIALSCYTEWGRESKPTSSHRYYSYKCPPFSLTPLMPQIVLAMEKWSQLMFFSPQTLVKNFLDSPLPDALIKMKGKWVK